MRQIAILARNRIQWHYRRQLGSSAGLIRQKKGISPTSSRGPTKDGRRKPDIAAPGVVITADLSPARFGLHTGTSFSAPHVSGSLKGKRLGRRDHGKGDLARGQGVRREGRNPEAFAARLSADMRAFMPCRRWRIGADSVPAGACLGGNHRAIVGLQATVARRRERQNRSGTVALAYLSVSPHIARPLGYHVQRTARIVDANDISHIVNARSVQSAFRGL